MHLLEEPERHVWQGEVGIAAHPWLADHQLHNVATLPGAAYCEMALTADHLVAIGRGRLIADSSTTDLIARSSQGYVHVRTPDIEGLARRLRSAGALVDTTADTMRVTGLDCAAVGELAALDHIVLHELTPRAASLEEAFMELTRDSVDYRTDAPVGIAS